MAIYLAFSLLLFVKWRLMAKYIHCYNVILLALIGNSLFENSIVDTILMTPIFFFVIFYSGGKNFFFIQFLAQIVAVILEYRITNSELNSSAVVLVIILVLTSAFISSMFIVLLVYAS